MAPETISRTKIGYLSALDIFRDLSAEELDWLGSVTVQSSCRAGEVIYQPGQSGEVLYLLKQGAVNLYRLSPDGHRLLIARLTDQSFFGEMSIFGQGMYDTFAEAASPCLLCALSRSDVERLVLSKPLVGLRVLEVLGRRLLLAHAVLEEMAYRRVSSRMAALLLRLGEGQPGGTVVGYTHQDLADMVGALRETATQTLNDFKTAGLIGLGRSRVEVLDGAALAEMAEGLDHHRDLPRKPPSRIQLLKRALSG